MNAIALDLSSGTLVDSHNGTGDIARGIIRAIGDPLKRFDEDGLRLFRAARFRAQLGFTIEASTLDGMRARATRILSVAMERQRMNYQRYCASCRARDASAEDTGLLAISIPEQRRGAAWMHRHDARSPPLFHGRSPRPP